MLIFDTTMVECNYAKTYAGRDGWTCQHSGLNSGNIMYLKYSTTFGNIWVLDIANDFDTNNAMSSYTTASSTSQCPVGLSWVNNFSFRCKNFGLVANENDIIDSYIMPRDITLGQKSVKDETCCKIFILSTQYAQYTCTYVQDMRQSIRANGEFMPGAAYDCVGTSFNTNQALKSTVAFLSSSWRHFQKSFEDNKDLLESFIGSYSPIDHSLDNNSICPDMSANSWKLGSTSSYRTHTLKCTENFTVESTTASSDVESVTSYPGEPREGSIITTESTSTTASNEPDETTSGAKILSNFSYYLSLILLFHISLYHLLVGMRGHNVKITR